MGVPVEWDTLQRINNKLEVKKESTPNHYLQYKTGKSSHVDTTMQSYIRMVTDQILLNELLKNIVMIDQVPTSESNTNGKSSFTYRMKHNRVVNQCDVIAVDEAHEHNTNMDVIITLMLQCLHYNPTMKLFIISATIDDDEPTYRTFFRSINDNRAAPFNHNIMWLNNDRINVDRRWHISAPGKTTRFVVQDIYLDDTNLFKINDTVDYDEAEYYGIKTAEHICRTTSSGDILFFSTTTPQLVSLTKELNACTPNNVACFPYWGSMLEQHKRMIQNIDKEIFKWQYSKHDIADIIGDKDENPTQQPSVPRGTYTRAIIIATNAAEASITITSLRFVIETGYANTVKYNVIANKDIQSIEPISESSRIQRRGRVGRVANGTVYYMYKKYSRQHIQTAKTICHQDNHELFFNLLQDSPYENLVIPHNCNPSLLCNLIDSSPIATIDKLKIALEQHGITNGLLEVLESLYYYNKQLQTYSYPINYLNTDIDESNQQLQMYSYPINYLNTVIDESKHQLSSYIIPMYVTGFRYQDILDPLGLFYIIHPMEHLCERSLITRTFLSHTDKNIKNTTLTFVNLMYGMFKKSKKKLIMKTFIDKSLKKESLDEPIIGKSLEKKSLDESIPTHIENINNTPNKIVDYASLVKAKKHMQLKSLKMHHDIAEKTLFASVIDNIKTNFDTVLGYTNVFENATALAYSVPYGVFDATLVVVTFLQTLEFKLKPLIANKQLDGFRALYGQSSGDHCAVLNVWHRFLDTFSYQRLNRHTVNTVVHKMVQTRFRHAIKCYNDTPKKLDTLTLKVLRTMEANYTLQSDNAALEFYKNHPKVQKDIIKDLIDKTAFCEWCSANYVNNEFMFKCVKMILYAITTCHPPEINTTLSCVYKSRLSGTDGLYENLTYCFIHAYGKHLVYNTGLLYIVNDVDQLNQFATDDTTQTTIAMWNPRTEQACTSITILNKWLLFLSPMTATEIQFIINVSLNDVLKRIPIVFTQFGRNLNQNSSTITITTIYNKLKIKLPKQPKY